MPELELEPESHVYRLRGTEIPGCTSVLTAMGAAPSFWFLSDEELEFYRSRGHAVHKMVELSVKGTLDKRTLTAEIKPYLIGWERFVNDYGVDFCFAPQQFDRRAEYECQNCLIRYPLWQVNDIDDGMLCTSCHIGKILPTKVEAQAFTEIPLHHEAYRYGVTPDVVARIKGHVAPIEIKATSAFSAATELQTAAQALAVEQVLGQKLDGPRWAVRLMKEEPYFQPMKYTERGDRSTWIGLLSSYNWLVRRAKMDPRRNHR